ncbi:hypothetical protein EG329_003516 [Mollisiaceae sp. DMI_Dod_QoI]|nr:hypothetical protein EG329_003516 [Helotiales sp. DMI_Dod_QoI]
MLLKFLISFFFVGFVDAQCNGNTALCSRKYSNVTQIGTHDSAFVGVLPTDNQLLSVTDQLNAGIRFLQAQTHVKNGALELCHTSCLEKDAGTLESYLSTVNTWMAANPNEVLTILLTNGDNADVSLFGTTVASSGISKYAYTPSSQLNYGADTSKVPYILDEFSYFFETAYDVTDKSFATCALDRPPGNSGSGLMMIVNHFLDLDILGILIPDELAASNTNAATGSGSIGAQADLCYSTWERNPNLILVDYFELGNVFTAQNTLNGL